MGRRALFKLNHGIFLTRLVQLTRDRPLSRFHGRRRTVGKIAIYSPTELKRPLQRSLSYPPGPGYSPIHRLESRRHSKTPFRPTLPFVLSGSDKVTFLKEANIEPTPSTPGAICQPGIIRFPRSFNEINNDGGKAHQATGEGREGGGREREE